MPTWPAGRPTSSRCARPTGWRSPLTPEDREFYHNIGGDRFSGTFARPGAQAPRRLSTDKNGTSVWVANWWGENIAKIDIKTKKVVGYYSVPTGANPYNTVVDKNHVVWTNLTPDDAVGKFDPKTEQWTIYKLPSIGAELRHIGFDDLRGDVWVPYREADRAARLQFRTQAQLEALKRVSRCCCPTWAKRFGTARTIPERSPGAGVAEPSQPRTGLRSRGTSG